MKRIVRLQFVAPVTYYLGWLAAILGAFSHFAFRLGNFASSVDSRLEALNLTQRNLFEASVLMFMICMASELRLMVSELRTRSTASSHTISITPAKQAA